jgi:hypothetical protein
MKRLAALYNSSPAFRKHIDEYTRIKGVAPLFMKVYHEQERKNKAVIENNKFIIDEQIKKRRGVA